MAGGGTRTPRGGAALGAALMLASAGAPAETARMYQWIDHATGTVQLAGRAPPWYRSGTPGPRVRVFERGRVIDDTAYPLPAAPPPTPSTVPAPAVTTPAPTAARGAEDTQARRAEFRALLEAWDREQAARAAEVRPGSESAVAAPPPD